LRSSLVKFLEKHNFDLWIFILITLNVGMLFQPSDIIYRGYWIPSGIPLGIILTFAYGYCRKSKDHYLNRFILVLLFFPNQYFLEVRIVDKHCISRLTNGECIELDKEGNRRLYRPPSKWEY
jgi:hypothetical protein